MFEQELINEIEDKLNELEQLYYMTGAYIDMQLEDYLEMCW